MKIYVTNTKAASYNFCKSNSSFLPPPPYNVLLFWITYSRVPHLKVNNLWTTVLLMLVRCMAHVSIRVETLLEMKIQFLLDLLATLLAKNPQHQCYHLSSTYTKKKRGKNLAKTNVLLCCDNQCLLCPFFQHAWRRT